MGAYCGSTLVSRTYSATTIHHPISLLPLKMSSDQMAVSRVGSVRTTFPAKLTFQGSDNHSCIELRMLRLRIPARLATFRRFIIYHNNVSESK